MIHCDKYHIAEIGGSDVLKRVFKEGVMRDQVLKYCILVPLMMLTVFAFSTSARAQGPCSEKTFNTFVSWAKKKDVKSFSSRLNLSDPNFGNGVTFLSQKPDTKNPDGVNMTKAEAVKALNTKNSEIWTFFNVHLQAAKYTGDGGEGGCIQGSLSSDWNIIFKIYEQRDGGWTIGEFGYEKAGKKVETDVGEDTQETKEDKTEPDNNIEGKEVLVEYNGAWYPAVILEQKDGKCLIHYLDYDSSWDEWVTKDRMKEKE